MEQLRLKYQQKPWTETMKLVHFCMDKPFRQPVSNAPDGPLRSCLEKIQRTLNAKSLFSVMNRLESLCKQKGLNAHISPSGTICYMTSNMFYIEVRLEKDGKVEDVKLAHFGEAPVVCDDLVQHLSDVNCQQFGSKQCHFIVIGTGVVECSINTVLDILMRRATCKCIVTEQCYYMISFIGTLGKMLCRMKNYDAFGKILDDLSNLYQTPGNSEMKAKGYLALRALEKDIYSMSLLDRTQDVNRVTEVLHGKVGHLLPRTGGTPMIIEFYISPYQALEAELNPGSQVCGTKAVVTIEGTDTLHRLSLSPLLVDSQTGEDGIPAFLPLTDELSVDLSAFFVMKFHQPIPMSSSNIEEIHRLTGIQITGLKPAPLYELIVQSTLKEKCSEGSSTHPSCFFVSLPDCPKHCYFINKGSGESNLAGALIGKIPFSHPKCVPGILEILRHQVAHNSLISSCVSERHINEDDSEVLYFEVVPHKSTSFSVFFHHPVKENLACVAIDVITSREVQCHLHLNPQDPTLNASDDFLTRAVKRCMSVPVVMRAIFRNAAKVKADSETQDMDAETTDTQPTTSANYRC